MLASDLLTADFPVLHPEDTLRSALDIFEDTCICHIPILKEDTLEGILPVDLLITATGQDQPLSSFQEDWLQAYAFRDQHGLEVFEIIAKAELSAIPVVDENRKYLGLILTHSLINRFSNYYSFRQIGGIIELTMGFHDYDLAEIARIVESNNARVIMQYMDTDEEKEQYRVTLKLDTLDLSHILATFDRYKYNISYHHPSAAQRDELDERYRLLMKLFDI